MDTYFKKIGIGFSPVYAIKIPDQMPEESIDLIFTDFPYNLSRGGFACNVGCEIAA